MTIGQQIALGFEEWELWFMVVIWMLIPIVIYYAKKQDERIAIMQKEADDILREWLKK